MAAEAQKKAETGGNDSMEDILHSIRDIIAEKTEGGSATADDDVLELTEMITPPAPEIASPPPVEGDVLSNIDAALGVEESPAMQEFQPEPEPAPQPAYIPQPEPEPAPAPAPQPAAAKPAMDKKNLVSDDSAKQAIDALKELRNNIPKPEIHSPAFRSGNTVEDLVVESIKPMLSDWLDANLPLIVRELVQKEIEKLVPHETRN